MKCTFLRRHSSHMKNTGTATANATASAPHNANFVRLLFASFRSDGRMWTDTPLVLLIFLIFLILP